MPRAGARDRTRDLAGGALAADLRAAVAGEVRFTDGDRALYATDASNYRQVPIGVVVPRTIDDVVATVEVCRAHDAPVLPRGAGTSLAGQGCNVAVVVDLSAHLNRILEVDPDRRVARVQPGVVLDDLRRAAEAHHLTYGPDPATHAWCTLGGMIGNNSCGVHSIMAGKTDVNVEELEVLTYDGLRLRVGATTEDELDAIVAGGGRRGELHAGLRDLRDRFGPAVRERYPDIPRRVSGYNLDFLLPERGFDVARALVGSEGTCATVLEATVRLVESPPGRALAVLGYPDVYRAADAVPEILATGCIGLEGFDEVMVEAMRRKRLLPGHLGLLPEGGGWLLVEYGAEAPEAAGALARSAAARLRRTAGATSVRVLEDADDRRRMWEIREAGLAATVAVPGEPTTWEGWEDAAVPPDRLGGYLRDLRAMADRFGYRCPLYGHFGDGCVHNRMTFDLGSREGVARYRAFVEEAADLVVSYGGSLSGEHGDGQSRGELLGRMYGEELVGAFRAFKSLWDPAGRMNPGKVVDPLPLDANLRMGPDRRPIALATRFRFPADGGSLVRAAERCVGVGKCRRDGGGVMCPSYRATRDERHSTRGRARLLFEMTRGDLLRGGWREDALREALDLCLACKGCKADCPAGVDVATYKAEFLHHHYRGRLRPRASYAVGLVPLWARLGSSLPALANALTGAPGISTALKAAGGIARERAVPRLAPRRLTSLARGRPPANPGRPEVILWPDTFTTHFRPGIGEAALEVLEAAGFRVRVPEAWVCCGRPLYDQGMLGLAERLLRRTLRVLGPDLRRGVPVVGLEPSCVAVFRDELPNLLAGDEDAERLAAQTFTFAEFVQANGEGLSLAPLGREAVVQPHCHQHAVMGFDPDRALLARAGVEARVLDEGCCGMAGAFGFEAGEKHRVSVAVGELGVLPAVRAAGPDALVVADGFSCREQIAQQTGRPARHLAEVVRDAVRAAGSGGA